MMLRLMIVAGLAGLWVYAYRFTKAVVVTEEVGGRDEWTPRNFFALLWPPAQNRILARTPDSWDAGATACCVALSLGNLVLVACTAILVGAVSIGIGNWVIHG